MNATIFGKRLKNIREKQLKISLNQIAKISGMSKSYHGHLENGNVEHPRHTNIVSIARAYGLSYHVVKRAYYPKSTKRDMHINAVLLQIVADEKLNLTRLGKKVLDEDIQANTKLFIIRLYEAIYKKKLL